ncbi:MAG: TPM domain-containing protein [Clostridia bacterium]|nr:TPM domain-containing protein [Clostridia bacterium]
MKKKFALLLVFLLCAGTALASGMPEASKDFYYYDSANVLDYETEAVIFYNNKALAKACGAEIVVAAIPTTGRDEIGNYAYKLFNAWGIGDKKKDNGFLLLLAVDDDDYYMTKGNGTGAIMTPGEVTDMLYDYLEADFAAKNYSAGVEKVFEQTFKTLTSYYGLNLAYQDEQSLIRSGKIEAETRETVGFGGADREVTAEESSEGSGIMGLVVLAIIVIIIVAIVKSRRKTRRRGAVIVPPANPTPTVVVAPRVRMTGGVRPRAARPARPVQYRSPSGLGGLFSGLSGLGGSSSSRSSSPSRSSSSSSRSSGWSSSSRSSSSSSRSSGFGGARGGGGHSSGSGGGRRR